jgi:hypothetical protein
VHPDPTIKKVDNSAAKFLFDKVSQFPGEVTLVFNFYSIVILSCDLCVFNIKS